MERLRAVDGSILIVAAALEGAVNCRRWLITALLESSHPWQEFSVCNLAFFNLVTGLLRDNFSLCKLEVNSSLLHKMSFSIPSRLSLASAQEPNVPVYQRGKSLGEGGQISSAALRIS